MRASARARSAEERDGDDERVFTRAVLGSKGGEMCQLRHVSFPALRDGVRWGVRGHDDGVRRAGRLVKLDPELVLPQTAYLGGAQPQDFDANQAVGVWIETGDEAVVHARHGDRAGEARNLRAAAAKTVEDQVAEVGVRVGELLPESQGRARGGGLRHAEVVAAGKLSADGAHPSTVTANSSLAYSFIVTKYSYGSSFSIFF